MYKAYVRHRLPSEGPVLKRTWNPDAWLLVCEANTRQGAHDEATRQIRGWNEGMCNPTLYYIHILEVKRARC